MDWRVDKNRANENSTQFSTNFPFIDKKENTWMNSSWHAAFQYPMHLFKRYSIWCACVLSGISSGRLFETPWTEAHQAPLSMGFSRQEYWSWWLCPPPGDLHNPGKESVSPALTGKFFTTREPIRGQIKTWAKSHFSYLVAQWYCSLQTSVSSGLH